VNPSLAHALLSSLRQIYGAGFTAFGKQLYHLVAFFMRIPWKKVTRL
jgi:hypothetical protein